MGRNSTEWIVETWTSWDMGDTSQPHLHGCWKVREQTRSWNHAEQKVEKKSCWHRLHQWARHQNNDPGQPPSHWFDECVYPTLEISKRCTKLSRTTCQTTRNASLSLVVISTLSWDQEKDQNVQVLANTHSTKSTKEVIGWKVGWC